MISLFLAGPAEAQVSGRRSVATVIFCGLGGAVVGLSTLSFYGSPQDHTGNIYTGLGLGLALGTAYVISASGGAKGDSASYAFTQKAPLGLSDFGDLRSKTPNPVRSVEIAAYRWDF